MVMSFAARWIAGEPVLNDELDAFIWVAPELPGDLQFTEGLQGPGRTIRPGGSSGFEPRR